LEAGAVERGVALAHPLGEGLGRSQGRAVLFARADQKRVGLGETVGRADLNHPAALRTAAVGLLILGCGTRRMAVVAGAFWPCRRRERRAGHEPGLDLGWRRTWRWRLGRWPRGGRFLVAGRVVALARVV